MKLIILEIINKIKIKSNGFKEKIKIFLIIF